MCGIAGRVNFLSGAPVDAAVIGRMCDLIAHRGPDGHGATINGPIGLGHRRLAIIDLSPLGRQPMESADGTLVITFNGEIYNFQELRDELEGHGYHFRSHSDTEVILAAYRQWGDGCVSRLVGMFAFALWDEPRRRLLLARDRLGKKPLYYRLDPDGIAFASEPKAFLADPRYRPEADLQSISQYLSYQYVPSPRSAFRGVEKLPPAHTLVVEDGRIKINRYWMLSYSHKLSLTEEEALEGLTAHLQRAVRRRLISDVPLGAFLSGGLDSSLVVSFMAESLDTPVQTFSIGFREEAYNELPAARLVAERYKTAHREFVVSPNALELLPQLVWHYGEPYADSSALPTYILSELTRRYVTVALNGDGGDESFAGYDRYLAALVAARMAVAPLVARRAISAMAQRVARRASHRLIQRAARLAERLGDSPERRYGAWVMHFDPEKKARLCTPEFMAATVEDSYDVLERAFAASDAEGLLERTMAADVQTYLPDDLLAKVDIATMAHGLEGRSPFLDHELMEFAASLPPRFKIRGREKKYLLRRLSERRLPPRLLQLPKKGFGVPIDHWFRNELRDFARDVLLDGRLASRGYFDMTLVTAMLDDHIAGRAVWHYPLWNLMMLELWHRMFIDQRPEQPPSRLAVTESDAPRLVAASA